MKKLWPVPNKLGIQKTYESIGSKDAFNKIIGDPQNWKEIRDDKALFDSWILPNAVLLFGKRWFDDVKWKNGKTKGLPFSIISSEQRKEAKVLGINVDDLPMSRSVIARVIDTTSKALKQYLEGRWYDGENIKPPGAYITESIKNNMLRDIGAELGYRTRVVPACPGCLIGGRKIVLVYEGLGYYSCPTCRDKLKNLKMLVKNSNDPEEIAEAKKNIEQIKRFEYFQVDVEEKLPTMHIWVKPDELTLDNENVAPKLSANQFNPDDEILDKQRIEILLEEIIIKMSRLNINSFSNFISWCFYMAVANWMANFWKDASLYFFGWTEHERDMTKNEALRFPEQSKKKFTNVIRGQDSSIHQSIFYTWMDILEESMDRITKMRPQVKSLQDLKWFCEPTKFSGGPKSVFKAEVSSKMSISNNSNIKPIKGKIRPRLARILSISAHNKDYTEDVRLLRWHSIHISHESELKPGDVVKVEAIMMPGHCTHAPIQRILRLRSMTLKDIINRIIMEEKTDTRDNSFWEERKIVLEKAKKIVKEQEDARKRTR